MHIDFTVQIWEEDNQFIAHAMPLDVMSSGASSEEARKALDEAVHLFLITAEEAGTLNDILEESGYAFVEGRWIGPAWGSIEKHSAVVGA